MANGSRLRGNCHCGNVTVDFQIPVAIDQLAVRECDCSFCRRHGAQTVAEPRGSLEVRVKAPRKLQYYRFGFRTADFLICRKCGIYVGAVLEHANRSYATLNARLIETAAINLRPASRVSYANETREERVARRVKAWTPAIVLTPPFSCVR